jgi:anti-sigma regulatory factor (Ser/Thr protein kinase)
VPLATSRPAPQFLTGADPEGVHWLGLPDGTSSGPAGVGAARTAASDWLRARGVPEETRTDTVLVLSELATNAIRHTSCAHFVCCVGLATGGRVHLEVHDHDSAEHRLAPRRPGPDDEGGRGLLLVQHLTERWGVDRSLLTAGNAVWARLAPGPGAAIV